MTTRSSVPLTTEIFLEDAFSSILDRLTLLELIDIKACSDRGFNHAVAILVSDIKDAMRYHAAAQTPWARATAAGGAAR
jgi:hypothetical protein